MSRSGYSDDCDGPELYLWRGAVERALKGKRGQAFLKEMLEALDGLPVKSLIDGDLAIDGAVCAIGSVGLKRGLDMYTLDPEDREAVGKAFGIAPAMAAEIMYENDEGVYYAETAETRFARMRAWVKDQIIA